MIPPPMGHSLHILFIYLTVLTAAPANEFDNWYFNALINGENTTLRSLDKNGDEMQTARETGSDSYEGKLADSEKHTLRIAIELKGRDLVKIRHVTPYNYSVLGLGRLQEDERIYFQFDGIHLEAPEQRFPLPFWCPPKKQ